MVSKRESVLQALHAVLQNVSGVEVQRNEVLPAHIPAGGLIILRDGALIEQDVTLSPVSYTWEHRAEVEVYVSDSDAQTRTQRMDDLLGQIHDLLDQDLTLGGAADTLTVNAPEITDEAVEGAAAIRQALVTVSLFYQSTGPLI